MRKSTTGKAQTWQLAYFWAKIDIEHVPARRFWIYFQNWQLLKLKVSMSRKNLNAKIYSLRAKISITLKT